MNGSDNSATNLAGIPALTLAEQIATLPQEEALLVTSLPPTFPGFPRPVCCARTIPLPIKALDKVPLLPGWGSPGKFYPPPAGCCFGEDMVCIFPVRPVRPFFKALAHLPSHCFDRT